MSMYLYIKYKTCLWCFGSRESPLLKGNFVIIIVYHCIQKENGWTVFYISWLVVHPICLTWTAPCWCPPYLSYMDCSMLMSTLFILHGQIHVDVHPICCIWTEPCWCPPYLSYMDCSMLMSTLFILYGLFHIDVHPIYRIWTALCRCPPYLSYMDCSKFIHLP